jgi:hypothetical protein
LPSYIVAFESLRQQYPMVAEALEATICFSRTSYIVAFESLRQQYPMVAEALEATILFT